MLDKSNLKITITQAVLEQLPSNNVLLATVISEWWVTKSGDSLRLSPIGDMMFRQAQIEFFDLPVKIKHTNWYKFLTDCNKKIKCPYFFSANNVKEPFIRLYDSKTAMMLTLYGDIDSYLESVRIRK